MSLFVLDTDVLTLYDRGDPTVVRRVDARPPNELAISVMTVDEQLTGWYTVTRQARRPEEIARAYARLGEAVVRLAKDCFHFWCPRALSTSDRRAGGAGYPKNSRFPREHTRNGRIRGQRICRATSS